MELMARAGYDPRAAIRLWEILNEAEREVERDEAGAGGAGGGESMWWDEWDAHAWLRTHPTGEERLERLRERLPNAVKLYDEAVRSRKVETEVRIAREVVRAGSNDGDAVQGPVEVVETRCIER